MIVKVTGKLIGRRWLDANNYDALQPVPECTRRVQVQGTTRLRSAELDCL